MKSAEGWQHDVSICGTLAVDKALCHVSIAEEASAQAGTHMEDSHSVPLWMVFGGGSMFLKVLYDELTKGADEPSSEASYKVIDAKKQD
ncbi:hypothetical protein E0H66_22880 [Rhizobium leguminosarum bv. viciae]|nr:hypothetical protein E0H66_22880 [Rhizobium leguminosarum bv. viciae]